MNEIAKRAGVSQPVVSAVLNNNYENCRVSEEKKERILAIARENHYSPNIAARSLKTRQTNIFNVVIPSGSFFQSPNYSTIITGLQEFAESAGYRLNFTSLSFGYKDYKQLNGIMADAIIAFYWGAAHDPVLEELKRQGKPVIAAYGRCTVPGVHNLFYDGRTALYNMVTGLIGRGYSKIGYAPLYTGDIYHQDGLAGIHQAVEENPGVTIKEYAVGQMLSRSFNLEEFFRAGAAGMRRVLSDPDGPTAVILNHDTAAMGAIRYAQSVGRKVPDDIAVCGNGNDPYSLLWQPSLSTVDLKPMEYGAALGAMALTVVKNDPVRIRKSFQPAPVFRESA